MDQEQVDRLLAEVIAQARAADIPVSRSIQAQVRINRRATGRFGCCLRKCNSYIIEMSARLLAGEERAVMQTLAHEILHTCPGCANHGPQWKGYAARMNQAYGYDISRTDSLEKLGLPAGVPTRYLLVCVKCGAQIGRSRLSTVVKHPERYRCRCGGRLERRR